MDCLLFANDKTITAHLLGSLPGSDPPPTGLKGERVSFTQRKSFCLWLGHKGKRRWGIGEGGGLGPRSPEREVRVEPRPPEQKPCKKLVFQVLQVFQVSGIDEVGGGVDGGLVSLTW